MQYSGKFDVTASPEEVFEFAVNLHKVASIVPDLVDYQVVEENKVRIRSKAGVSFIRGIFTVNLDVQEKVPFSRVIIRGIGSGAGASISFTVEFTIDTIPEGSTVAWNMDLTVAGVAATLGSRMINNAVQKYVDELVASFEKALA